MSTAAVVAPPRRRPGFGALLSSEWTKIRSVRSTVWSLILLVITVLGFTTLFMGLSAAQWDSTDNGDVATFVADPVAQMLGSGFFLGQLAICVLGVMIMGSEYSTGMIRSSLLAVPKRIPMLAAKSTVFFVLVLIIGEIVSFGSYFIGTALIGDKVRTTAQQNGVDTPIDLGDPGVLRAVIGGGLYLAVLGLFALAIGAIVRHSAAGITGTIAFVLVLAPLSQLIPGSAGDHIHAYLPTEAGHLIAQARQTDDDLLTPVQGYGVFVAWTVVMLLIAAFLLKRRDA